MRQKRLLIALGAVVFLAAAYVTVSFWRASRVLRTSAIDAAIPFSSSVLNLQIPTGFETIAAPAGFRDAVVYSGRLFVAGGGGLFEYGPSGELVKSYRAGLEFPASPVVALAASQELWMATAGEGALAFDGSRFRQLLPDAAEFCKMTAVLPLPAGRVLFGTAKSGVIAFDGKQFAPFDESLAKAAVTALAGDDSSLWVGTADSGVLHWHAGRLNRITEESGLPDSHVFSILVDGDRAYAATALGVAEIREDRVARVLARGFTVQSVAKAPEGLLAGTLDEGLVRVPLAAKTQAAPPRPTACPDCNVLRLIESGGEVLALTPDGLYRTRSWTPVLAAGRAQLTDRNISALAPDDAGRLWIGYFDRGMDILDAGAGSAKHSEDDVLFCVNRIVHDRDRARTAVATSNGLAMFSPGGQKRQVLTRADGLIANQVTDVLFRPDGSMIAGTPAGVSFIEPARISSLYAFQGLVNNHVYALGQMGPRTLVGTLGGLSVIESGLVSASYTTSNSGFKHNWITAVLPAGNDVFIGTYGGGIVHPGPGGSWTGFADLPPSFDVNENAMAASDRAVYAGTLDRGLAMYDRGTSRWRWIVRGLPSMNVTAVAVDRGVVYVGTDNGLIRIQEDALLR